MTYNLFSGMEPNTTTFREAMDPTEEALILTELNELQQDILHNRLAIKAAVPEVMSYCDATERFRNGFRIATLGDAGMMACPQDGVIILNRESLAQILSYHHGISQESRTKAAALFALHEAFHIAQGIGHHEDVKTLKEVAGAWVISFLDLRSTTVAANLLTESIVTRTHRGDPKTRRREFESIWIDTAHRCLAAFPVHANPTKCQRFLGHLLMSALLMDTAAAPSWHSRQTIWPQWSVNYDRLSLLSNDLEVFLAPTDVPSNLLRTIVDLLCIGGVAQAFPLVRSLAGSVFCSTNCTEHEVLCP